MSRKHTRLDMLLVNRGIAEDIKHANALILSGNIFSENKCLDKPGEQVSPDLELITKFRKNHPWVSRGGVKLAHAIAHFSLDVSGLVAMDIGASTGGFTDVLLANGAAKVYAIDVGYGQLDWKLQNNNRVVVMDRTNARYLSKEHIAEPIDIVVCDASFISLKTILPTALTFTKNGALLVALIKPQFELPKEDIGEGGVVHDELLHRKISDSIVEWLRREMGWIVLGVTESPITGQKGNKEFLIAGKKP